MAPSASHSQESNEKLQAHMSKDIDNEHMPFGEQPSSIRYSTEPPETREQFMASVDAQEDYFSEEFLAKKKEFVDRMVEEMTKKAPWQWRLTSEQKPDIQVHVLTVNRYGDVTVGKMTGVGEWYDMADTNWDGIEERIDPAPTHWMPLPDPPQP